VDHGKLVQLHRSNITAVDKGGRKRRAADFYRECQKAPLKRQLAALAGKSARKE